MRTNTSSRCQRQFDQLRRPTRRRLISPANSGPKRFHQYPYRLMADVDTALEQQILDLSQRQWVADIHHHREADDFGRTVEVAEGISHLAKLWMPHLRINPFLSDNAVHSPSWRRQIMAQAGNQQRRQRHIIHGLFPTRTFTLLRCTTQELPYFLSGVQIHVAADADRPRSARFSRQLMLRSGMADPPEMGLE